MNIQALKTVVETHRQSIAEKKGIVSWSPTGPVGIQLIDALVQALEFQDARLTALEKAQDTKKSK